MKQRFLFATAWLLAVSAFAQIPQGYYSTAAGLTGDPLKSALNDIIDGHEEFSYGDCYDLLEIIDADPSNPGNVIGIYSQFSMDASAQFAGGSGWNREHVWPRSRGELDNDSRGANSDLHHLRAEDVSTNSARQNFIFDYAPNDYVDGSGTYSGPTPVKNGNSVWEPGDAQKGDVARMMFYMATRYEGENGNPDLELTDQSPSLPQPLMGKLSTLLEWHVLDPVDQLERDRHERIFSYQDNRNPFIDHPEWVDAIWGETSTETPLITLSITEPLNFGVVSAGESSAAQSYTVSGSDLTGDILLSTVAPFELSSDNSNWSNALTVSMSAAEAGGAVVYVRFSPEVANRQSFSEVVSHTSTGANAVNKVVTGTEGETSTPTAWINEVHYNNVGADRDEFVEIYVENSQSYAIADFQVELINGADGEPYGSFSLSTATAGTVGYYYRNFGGIQNGPDAIKLLYRGDELNYISYGGSISGADEISVTESDETPEGKSLQLCCAGTSFDEMIWLIGDASPGQPNLETLLALGAQPLPIYPNPTQGSIHLDKLSPTKISARLLTLNGQELFKEEGMPDSLEVQLNATLSTVHAGVYILEIRSASKIHRITLHVQD